LHLVSSPWMMPMRAIWLEESCPIVRTAPKASPLRILRIQLVSAYGSTVIGCAWCLHQEGCRCGLFGSRKAVRSCERPQRLHHEASCVCASFGSMKPNTYGAYTALALFFFLQNDQSADWSYKGQWATSPVSGKRLGWGQGNGRMLPVAETPGPLPHATGAEPSRRHPVHRKHEAHRCMRQQAMGHMGKYTGLTGACGRGWGIAEVG
jgi:hypothetical protein